MVFHNHKCTVELDNPHSIYAFNCFEEKGHVEQRYDNFKLIDWTQEDQHTVRILAILDDDDDDDDDADEC